MAQAILGALAPVILDVLLAKGRGEVEALVGPRKGGGLKKAASTGAKKVRIKKKKPGKPKKNARKKAARAGKSVAASTAPPANTVIAGALDSRAGLPAQYASASVQLGTAVLRRTQDGCVMRLVDYIGNVDPSGSNGAGGAFKNALNTGAGIVGATYINPENAVAFPTYFIQGEMWERWRPLGFALHYRQATSSATAGSVHLGMLASDNTTEASAMIDTTGAATANTFMSLKGSRMGALNQDLSAHWEPEMWNPKEGGAPWYECGTSFASGVDGTPARFNICVDAAGANPQTGKIFTELVLEFAGPRAPYTGAAGLGTLARLARTKLTDAQKGVIRARFVKAVEKLYKEIIVPLDKIQEITEVDSGLSKDELRGALVEMSKRLQSSSVSRRSD